MFQETLNLNLQKLLSFLRFAKSFLVRKNPLKTITKQFEAGLKDFLTMNKKIKMARYRLSYQKHKLAQMEQLIAQSNDHVFLKGKTLNETR